MYLIDNPVLQRELLVNLRMNRAFALLAVYLSLLGAVVWLASAGASSFVTGQNIVVDGGFSAVTI